MQRTSLLTIGLMTAFLVSVSAQAATTNGRVVAADTTTNVFTIQTEDGRRFSFQKSDATTFDYRGATVRLEDLKPGAKVAVTSDAVPSDPGIQLPATHVQIDEMVGEAPVSVARTMEDDLIETPMADRRLPNTATPLPVVAAAGVGSILAGIALCLRRR
jgi:hypothetical protein